MDDRGLRRIPQSGNRCRFEDTVTDEVLPRARMAVGGEPVPEGRRRVPPPFRVSIITRRENHGTADRAPASPTPGLNALIIGAFVLVFVVAGVVVWTNWSRESVTAVEEAHEAVVQPVETLVPPSGAQPARPSTH